MLQLKDITKTYGEKENAVVALKGISLSFRQSEFVSVLGQSGCGKTTLLNIIGGLDRYSGGDLVINGKSTKNYSDREWDTYRNHSIGFVFQSYNLIPHQTVLENVELTMTLGGVSRSERRKRAKDALIAVGLEEKMNKHPNELSGGQMQRVSIARALVGDPDIILADEPTGALDSETSVTVMDLLKEISKTRLVIMVTHNPDLAGKYSDRIIRMLDGVVEDDSRPLSPEEEEAEIALLSQPTPDKEELKYKKKHSSMSLLTAMRLSAKNMLSKKKRMIITSFAASIGLIGMAIILSISNGMQNYIDKTMLDSAQYNYISVSARHIDINGFLSQEKIDLEEFPENTTGVYPYKRSERGVKNQVLTDEYVSYVQEKTEGLVIDIAYTYGVSLHILTQKNGEYTLVPDSNWSECLSNEGYMSDRYDVLAKAEGVQKSGIPLQKDQVALVVDSYNRLSTNVLDSLGIPYDENLSEIKYSDLLGKEYRVVFNDAWYRQNDETGWFDEAATANYADAYASDNGLTVRIVSILRVNKDANVSWLSSGIAYSPTLTQEVLTRNKDSAVGKAQAANEEINVTTGRQFLGSSQENVLRSLGCIATPSSLSIYPTNSDNRELIKKYLDEWNENQTDENRIEYNDMSELVMSLLNSIVKIITYVLMAFSITSLVISSIMIAIIIYASVIERTKEIGVLRSIGARKRDISHVFESEAVLLGLISGIVAIIFTLIINAIINAILNKLVGVSTIAVLAVGTAFGIIGLSVFLLLLASLIPARIAAKKEPAVALRTE